MSNRSIRALLLAALLGLVGCANATLSDVYHDYRRQQYQSAYDKASSLVLAAGHRDRAQRQEAALLAGLAAYRLKRSADAQRYLDIARQSQDPKIAGDAYATIGLMRSTQGRYESAFAALMQATKRLKGEGRARAYYYAAMAKQKLGHRSTAYTYLTLADQLARDPLLRDAIGRARSTTGWTIQTNAFHSRSNAQTEARRVNQQARGKHVGQADIVQSVDAQGKTLYLVQIGRFSSYATASTARNRIGLAQARLVPLAEGGK